MINHRVFKREEIKCRVWADWKKADTENQLPEHFTMLEGELKEQFEAEARGRQE